MIEYIAKKPMVAFCKAQAKKTDKDLATALRISVASISRYLNGSPVPYPSARLLAEELGTSVNELFEERATQPGNTAEQFLQRNGLADASAEQAKAV